MPGCVLRAGGIDFEVDDFLVGATFEPCKVFRQGEPRSFRSSKKNERSGFNLVLSNAEQLPDQISDAIRFLHDHREELLRLANRSDVEGVYIDFGCDFPFERTPGQFHRFPLNLLRECAGLGIEIELSVYASSDVNEESK